MCADILADADDACGLPASSTTKVGIKFSKKRNLILPEGQALEFFLLSYFQRFLEGFRHLRLVCRRNEDH